MRNVPALRFGEFSAPWIEQSLFNCFKEILDFRGRTPLKLGMNWGGGDILSLSANNVKDGYIDTDSECHLASDDLYDRWMGKVNLSKGDIIFTMEAPLGKAVLLPDDKKYILSQRVVAFKTNSGTHNPFLIQVMWSPKFKLQLDKLATGSTAKGINQKSLRKVRVSLCEQAEQQKIAAFLTAVDTKIEQLTQKEALLKQYKKGVMQKIFSQEMRFKADDGSEFPEWVYKTIGQVASVNPKAKELPDEFRYIDLESVEKGRLLRSSVVSKLDAPSRAQRLVQNDDILFQTVRPYQGNNLYFNFGDGYVASTGYAQIRAKQSSGYLYHVLSLQSFINDVLVRCTGSSYPAINSSDLASIHIPMPCIKEQIKIAEFISGLDIKIAVVAEQLEAVKTFKKGLLQQMFV